MDESTTNEVHKNVVKSKLRTIMTRKKYVDTFNHSENNKLNIT